MPAYSAARKRPQAPGTARWTGVWAEEGQRPQAGLIEAAVTLGLPSWESLFIEKQAKVFETGDIPDC